MIEPKHKHHLPPELNIEPIKPETMKKIKNLSVTVTYSVGLGDLEVPEKLHKQLNEVYENGGELESHDIEHVDSVEWMNDNIKEADCLEWKCEIVDLN